MKKPKFEGWYFKHQKGENVAAFIPGRAESGAFVQLVTDRGSRMFPVSSLTVEGDVIRAGNCRFSPRGCHVDLPGIRGDIDYGPLRFLGSDIMGPFRHLPMECRHAVLSMGHSLRGKITMEGRTLCFDGGTGYIESDAGTSFPSSYLWVQCNTFPEPWAITAAVAHIPHLPVQGCICSITHGEEEYRFATYRGVRVQMAEENRLCLTQGPYLLDITARPEPGQSLASPVKGRMSATVQESCNTPIRARLWKNGLPVFDLKSREAAWEYFPGVKK